MNIVVCYLACVCRHLTVILPTTALDNQVPMKCWMMQGKWSTAQQQMLCLHLWLPATPKPPAVGTHRCHWHHLRLPMQNWLLMIRYVRMRTRLAHNVPMEDPYRNVIFEPIVYTCSLTSLCVCVWVRMLVTWSNILPIGLLYSIACSHRHYKPWFSSVRFCF